MLFLLSLCLSAAHLEFTDVTKEQVYFQLNEGISFVFHFLLSTKLGLYFDVFSVRIISW